MKLYSDNCTESKITVYPKLYKSTPKTGRQSGQSFQQEK